jgi:hypothetical protein
MTVNLNTCVPGQKVRLRTGEIVEYQTKFMGTCCYPHEAGSRNYTDDGYYFINKEENFRDVVEILPLETIEPTKDDEYPSVAWWESCPWITDRKPTEKDGNRHGHVHIQSVLYGYIVPIRWSSVQENMPWLHTHDWKPPVLTNKEQALELLNKHEGGWWPTPKEWAIIRKGLEEST